MSEDIAVYKVTCRGCGKAIHFVDSAVGGKKIPCDLERRHITPGMGRDALVDDAGHVIRGVLASEDADVEPGMVGGWISHFATCAKAEEFRKAK